MVLSTLAGRRGGTIAGAALCTVLAFAQSGPASVAPLRTTPTEKLTVNPGFRDWAPTTITGTTILGGNSSNKGGLFAVDTLTGKVKWSTRATIAGHSGAFVATAPAVSGDVVVVPIGNTLVGLALATGKELWRGPATQIQATVVASGGLVYVLGDDDTFYAFDAKTGREQWKLAFARLGFCESRPAVRDGTVYVNGAIEIEPANAVHPARRYQHLFALDASTGQERWRYPSAPIGTASGVCLSQPVVTADTFFSISGATLYAVELSTGRERWKPAEIRGTVEGRVRPVEMSGMVDAGPVLVGVSRGALLAFDKTSGQKAWEVPGQYRASNPSTAVAGRVLYFQGDPGAASAADVLGRGTLRALDLDTRAILWSFSRPTAEANWSFGYVMPIDGGLWVDSYQALVKLQ